MDAPGMTSSARPRRLVLVRHQKDQLAAVKEDREVVARDFRRERQLQPSSLHGRAVAGQECVKERRALDGQREASPAQGLHECVGGMLHGDEPETYDGSRVGQVLDAGVAGTLGSPRRRRAGGARVDAMLHSGVTVLDVQVRMAPTVPPELRARVERELRQKWGLVGEVEPYRAENGQCSWVTPVQRRDGPAFLKFSVLAPELPEMAHEADALAHWNGQGDEHPRRPRQRRVRPSGGYAFGRIHGSTFFWCSPNCRRKSCAQAAASVTTSARVAAAEEALAVAADAVAALRMIAAQGAHVTASLAVGGGGR